MEKLLWVIGALCLIIVILLVKIILMQKGAREIAQKFAEILTTDTNTLIDVSSRDRNIRRLANEINVELRKLRAQRIRFNQGDAEVKDAITNISHDLRTPLTAISGYLELLEKEEKSEAAQRYIGIIRDRTEHMKQLCEELFRYSIVISTANSLYYERVTVNAVLEESISSYYAALTGANITPKITICENKIIRFLDKNALSRIFSNLIGNAIKYSDGDLAITLSESGAVTFSNHASMLDETQTGKLFNRFFTVENAEKSTGLGLSIAKALTEEMGGTITAKYDARILSIQIVFPISNQ